MQNKMCNLLPEMVSLFLLSFAFKISSSLATKGEGKLQTYIVFLEKPERAVLMRPKELDRWYQTFLPASALKSNQPHILYSYRNVIVGFAAKITAQEVKFMERKKGFVSARPEKMFSLHTTHTPSFLGLQPNIGFWNYSKYGKGVIIGLLDTGITPDHSSFSDKGMPSPPVKWKGKCEFSETTCNRKLIGARNFISAGVPPYDEIGHGTHTASTAAGSPVQGANFYGQANGTAVGIAPLAHLAMYKVCSEAGCGEAEILAAMDSAVDDGVDVLSLSLGGSPLPFYNDGIAIGAFRAIQKGTFVSCSAGNSGPDESSLSNEAPWIATVGASTVDREIRATVLLGNNSTFDGQSLFQPEDFPSFFFPLVYAGANGDELSAFCAPGSLRNVDIKGKIVLCERGGEIDRIGKGEEVLDGGGVAMILMNDELSGYVTSADAHVLPASHVSYMDGLAIKSYLDSIASPIATIKFEGTVTGLLDAPKVASFSSRGPSLASPGVLKPDIIGPGVSILAAWPISADDGPNTKSTFNMISGTSMSCPHISGVAALLKSAHPDWSPAAIKSAIITTARLSNMEGKPISDQQLVPANVFDIGAGHVNPSEANNPGLVYDIQPEDYIPYLCGLGYSDKEIKIIVQRTVKCSNGSSIPEAQLNYPSFSIKLASDPRKYTRTVTNVGLSGSSFTHEIIAPRGVNVEVTPTTLVFNAVNQKATYSVTFSKNEDATGSFAQGYLTWKSDLYSVRSPIAVIFE